MRSSRSSLGHLSTKIVRSIALAGFFGFFAPTLSCSVAGEPSSEGVEFFEKRIRPILAGSCYSCHSVESKKSKGGLLLDTRDNLLKGGDSGPALVAGYPEKSLLIRAVRQTDEQLRMPPKEKLTAAAVADLEAWVQMGAPDPRGSAPGKVLSKIGVDLEKARHVLVAPAGQGHADPQGKESHLAARQPWITLSWPASKGPASQPRHRQTSEHCCAARRLTSRVCPRLRTRCLRFSPTRHPMRSRK